MSHELTNKIEKDTGEGTIMFQPWAYSSITQGTWVVGVNTSYTYNGYYYNSSNSLADQIDYKAWLSKGYYALVLEAEIGSSLGIVGILLDGTVQSSIDFFDAGLVYRNSYGAQEVLYVPTSGVHTVSFKLISKHPTASGYYMVFNSFELLRMN